MLAKLQHNMATGPDMKSAVEALRNTYHALPTAQMRANARDAIESFDRQALISAELAEREARLEQQGYGAWHSAREASNWTMFAPVLEKLVELKREVATVTRKKLVSRPGGESYDGAIDQFERGMTAGRVDELFGELRTGLLPLLEAILAKKSAEPQIDAPHPALVAGPHWSLKDQEALAREVATEIGYDFSRGRLDVSTHPFTGGAGPNDVRITTRFSDDWMECFGAVIHETGHALYEQGRETGEEGRGLPSSQALSMGIHESQSLLWERMVLQSRPFWDWATPKFHERFPFTKEASAEDFYRHYNRVEPGLIRVAADEVTYPLHVILRYEIERSLFKGELSVAEIPALWNKRMKSDLGVHVPDDAKGALQDIHWSLGSFGYFPSYTLGAMAAVQIFQAWIEHEQAGISPSEELVAYAKVQKGDFAPLRKWLQTRIHAAGSVIASPDELLKRVTGSPLSVEPFLSYLRAKYGQLYCLDLKALEAAAPAAAPGRRRALAFGALTGHVLGRGRALVVDKAIPFLALFTTMTGVWCAVNNAEAITQIGTPSVQLPNPAMADDGSNEWLEAWRERMQLWWVATPYKKALESCMGAFGIHLAERFDMATRLKQTFGVASAPPAAQQQRPVDSEQCEWLKSAELQLPDFPEVKAQKPSEFRMLQNLRKIILPIPRLLLPELGGGGLMRLFGAEPDTNQEERLATRPDSSASVVPHANARGPERRSGSLSLPQGEQEATQRGVDATTPALLTGTAAVAVGVGGAALALTAAGLVLWCRWSLAARGRVVLQSRPALAAAARRRLETRGGKPQGDV